MFNSIGTKAPEKTINFLLLTKSHQDLLHNHVGRHHRLATAGMQEMYSEPLSVGIVPAVEFTQDVPGYGSTQLEYQIRHTSLPFIC
jgi:hypothetical protein